MLSKSRLPLTTLISYVLSFTADNVNKNSLESIFPNTVKSNDEFSFESLKIGESKNINDFPKKLKTIFDPFIKDLKRHGSKKYFDDGENNISLYYSILSNMVNNFNQLPKDDQFNYIKKLRDKLILFLTSGDNFNQFNYHKLGWVRKDILNSMAQFQLNKLILKIMADYLHINIIMLNVIEDLIYIVSETDSYDMFRRNVILVYNTDEYFEPLTYSDTFLLDYNTSIIKKLVTVDKNFLMMLNINLSDNEYSTNFSIKLSDISYYLPKKEHDEHDSDQKSTKKDAQKEIENEYGEIIPTESDANAYVEDIENTSNKKNSNSNQLVFNISSRMKIKELQNIAEKLNIDITKKTNTKESMKTKAELIDDINNILKKN